MKANVLECPQQNKLILTPGSSTNLLVDLGPVAVALLAGTCNGVCHTGWMPGANARHLPQAFVSLPGKLLCVPAARHTCLCSGASGGGFVSVVLF